MASDWIKMRVDLFTHPKVVRMASALKADTLRTVGGLMSAWCLFDAHSVDGRIEGYSSEYLDEHLRWPGFSAAMIAVGWLFEDSQALELPSFDTHNGASAKRRAQDAERKRNVRKVSASDADETRTREEKRREEDKSSTERKAPLPSRFDDFWTVYPNKKGKVAAEKVWKRKRLDLIADQIIADVLARVSGDRQWLEGFIPHGSTYVNAEGWRDAIEPPRKQSASGYVPLPGEF